MKKAFVTGARGFLGANLITRLKERGIPYVRFDALDGDRLERIDWLTEKMAECDFVFHLAANADVRGGWKDPRKDLNINTVGTANVLEAMRANGIKRIGFASSSAVYGEARGPAEDCPWPIQTSLYGASKVAGEALIQAYAEGQGFEPYIFRFVPLLGEGYRHGHVYDFVKQLLSHPDYLMVRGDGTQRKSYLYVHDAITAMFHLVDGKHTGIYNVCSPETCAVNQSVAWIQETMGPRPIRIDYTGGSKGWVGDAPNLNPDPSKLYSTGWKPTLSIYQSMQVTVKWMLANKEIFS